ncbi:MAG: nuclear transport factor 2 family protein [Pseudomonadota bacterium]|uniref:nuclear transport factor 2 family protein n=1 Tax=Sphingomonas sp. ERG5 TaxID=1381597 RepID=UPI00054BEA50|nr:nuclear transport factor 2 family protein [Sphingomonas sp. ERG5]
MKGVLVSFLVLISAIASTVSATPVPASFDSTGTDKAAIETLLDSYTKAVSTKDQALFESLLLNKAIPFSSASSAIKAGTTEQSTRHYDDFRKGVFEGPKFTQRFQDIHIQQDGPLANVSLVFVNTSSQGSNWGWKTLQLLKVDGRWKIASEFFTNHD